MRTQLLLLLLLVIANGAPVIGWDVLHARLGAPLDLGRRAPDGRPWLGPSKTWRGILMSILATVPAAWILGFTPWTGLRVALGAMAGDLFSSFVKRRLGRPSGSRAAGLDQIPESVLPLLWVRADLGLSFAEIGGLALAFLVLAHVLSPILYGLKLRKHPY